MDLYMVILRLLHIPAGIVWVGFSLFMMSFAMPAALSMEDRGGRFVRALYNTTPLLRVFPITALVTTVAGVLLYLRVSDNFNANWLTSGAGIVLTIGSLAGLAAFFHGIGIGRRSEAQKELLNTIAGQPDGPTPAQGAQLAEIGQKQARATMISVVLMVIAVVGMSTARYF